MIVFDLRCVHGHGFEGWFASSEEFVRQQGASLVRCPLCDDAHVERMPSARVRVSKGATIDAPPESAAPAEHVAGFPPDLVAKLREVVRNTEDVGERFPEEARRIHYDEAPARSIRGVATLDETRELLEEGIAVLPAPVPPEGELH